MQPQLHKVRRGDCPTDAETIQMPFVTTGQPINDFPSQPCSGIRNPFSCNAFLISPASAASPGRPVVKSLRQGSVQSQGPRKATGSSSSLTRRLWAHEYPCFVCSSRRRGTKNQQPLCSCLLPSMEPSVSCMHGELKTVPCTTAL